MGVISDPMRNGDLAEMISSLSRRVDQLETARRLEAATVGRGGVRVRGQGGVRVQDGGDVQVEDGGAVEVVGGVIRVIGQGGIQVVGGGSVEVTDQGAVIVRHDNGALGAVYGDFANLGTGGAEDGHGLLVRADTPGPAGGTNIFRAKQTEAGDRQVFVGSTVSGTPEPVDVFGVRADLAQINAYGQAVINSEDSMLVNAENGGLFFPDHLTTSAAANLHIDAGTGLIRRSTSSARYKVDISDYRPARTILDLAPRSWRDRAEVERDPATTNRYVGLVAEEVHDLGLTEFVTYDEAGRPDAVAYDRLAVGLIDVVRAQQAQLDALTEWAAGQGYRPPAVTGQSTPAVTRPVKATPSRAIPRPPRRPGP